jgi:hypothetical protein
MRVPSLSTFAAAFKYVRLYLFLALLATAGWQALALVRGPAAEAQAHGLVAVVALIIGARLYLAKKSSFNRALAEVERLAARKTEQEA